jgi:hypothetical protein
MQQTTLKPDLTNEHNSVKVTLNQAAQAKQWLDENREAIDSYKAKQAEQGQTFSELAGQI